MTTKEIGNFGIVGIAVRTTNENGQAMQDIPALWQKFMSEGVMEKIPNKIEDAVYCVYTAYESDFTKPYTTLLGCKVGNLDDVPEGMQGMMFDAGNYAHFISKGNVMQGSVYQSWTEIWNSDLPRAYKADFEVYGPKASNMEDAEVDIYIGVKREI
jgi:predicted transcriptional regulator YdeE